MTIDETIKYFEEKAEELERRAKLHQRPDKDVKGSGKRYLSCLECANEYKQRAQWLRELKAYREILENADNIIKSEYGCIIIEGYADVVDKMNKVYKEMHYCPNCGADMRGKDKE